MSHTLLELYVHLVWATRGREPLINRAIERRVWAIVAAAAKRRECRTLAVGGIENHVHSLVEVSPRCSIGDLVHQLKGASSFLIRREVLCDGSFNWQEGYSASTVRKADLVTVGRYIANQREHHRGISVLRARTPQADQPGGLEPRSQNEPEILQSRSPASSGAFQVEPPVSTGGSAAGDHRGSSAGQNQMGTVQPFQRLGFTHDVPR